MKLPQPFTAAKRRVRRKQTARPAAPPGPVTVVAVQFVDEFHVYWKFSSPLISWDDVSGLTVGTQNPGEVTDITPEGWLELGYNGEVAGGDVWEVTGGVTLLFESGTELQTPQSGVVTT